MAVAPVLLVRVPSESAPLVSRRVTLGAVFCGLYLAAALWLAFLKPLWYDELFTLHFARLPAAELWSALADGADPNPPLGYLVARLSTKLFGENEVALRLPSVLGFGGLCLCLYRFVRRRCSAPYAWAASLVPLASAVYPCVCEARSYALVLGCCGLALVCWQAAAESQCRGLSLAGLSLALAAALGCHYYAVLLWLPLVAGELGRTLARRRIDWPVWLALVAPLLLTPVLFPLLRTARQFSAGFWARPDLASLGLAYHFLLAYWKTPLILSLGAALVYPRRANLNSLVARVGPPAHELIAVAVLAALPVWGFLLGRFVTGVFTFRYVFPAIAGLAVLWVFILYRRTQGSAFFGKALVVILVGLFVQGEVRNHKFLTRSAARLTATCSFLQEAGPAPEPVVISDALLFLQLSHYAPPELASRLVYLDDPQISMRILGQNTADLALARLRDHAALRIVDYGQFLDGHPRFLLFECKGWAKTALDNDGVSLEVIARDSDRELFAVRRRN